MTRSRLYEMEVTVAILDITNVQNIQSLSQTKYNGVNVSPYCKLLSKKLGATYPNTVGTARFVIWDLETDGSTKPSFAKLVSHIRENVYQLLDLRKRKSFTIVYANGDMKNEVNRDIDDDYFSFSEFKIIYKYKPTDKDQKPAAAPVMKFLPRVSTSAAVTRHVHSNCSGDEIPPSCLYWFSSQQSGKLRSSAILEILYDSLK